MNIKLLGIIVGFVLLSGVVSTTLIQTVHGEKYTLGKWKEGGSQLIGKPENPVSPQTTLGKWKSDESQLIGQSKKIPDKVVVVVKNTFNAKNLWCDKQKSMCDNTK